MCSCFIFFFEPERRVRRGLRFRPPPAAEQGRNLRRSGRRLARRPCRRRQSRAPQEGLPSKFKSLFLRQIKQLYFVQLLYFLLWARAPGPARAEISTAACGGAREKSQAQRPATGKAATPPQTEPGTARGLAKQVQIPLSPPNKAAVFCAAALFFALNPSAGSGAG